MPEPHRTDGDDPAPGSYSALPDTPAERPLAVVIVTYHSAAVVEGCLTSLPAALRGVGEHRVIVVDNASTDDTLAVVAAAMPAAEIVRRAGNGGFAAGVNTGIATGAGCDVLVLNPDVRLEPGAVAALRAELHTPGCGIAVPRLSEPSGTLAVSLRRRPTVLRTVSAALLGGSLSGRLPLLSELVWDERRYQRPGRVDWATGAAWLISRPCADALGPLDERYFLYSEETEYMLRAGDRGFAVHYRPDAAAVHLGGEQASSPWLWALSATNKVRLHRERHGAAAAAAMWLAMVLNEVVRAAARPTRRPCHLAALRSLLRFRRWPSVPGSPSGHKDPDYLVFAAQDWWYHNRAHSDFQLMRSVARKRRVLVVNSIGMRMPLPGRSTQVARRIVRKLRSVAMFVRRPVPGLPGFIVMSPLPLPLYGSHWGRRLNAALVRTQVRAVCAVLGIRAPVVVLTLPTAWDVVAPMSRTALVYNRSDRHSAFRESNQAVIAGMERELLETADHVLYVSRSLRDEERELTGDRAHLIDHGVDLDHFRLDPHRGLPADLEDIPRPRVGFFGALDDQVVDFALLQRLATELPGASLVLIGDATRPMHALTSLPNVHWLGFRPYEEIPDYGATFDVAIMPWVDSEWIRHSNPIKLKEYLALGLPVVTTEFAEVARYADVVRVATDPDQFVELVRRTLADGGAATPPERRLSVAGASWSGIAERVMTLAEEQSW